MTLLDAVAVPSFTARKFSVLETERLVLRAPRLDDAEAIATLINDRRIAENLARVPHPYTLADAEGFIASANREDGRASFVTTLANGTIIGGCGVGKLSGTDPEIGYWLGVPYWGNGYATEVTRAVIDHAFTNLGYERLEAGARVSNPASRRVLEKCGFQWTGVGLCRIRALASSVPIDRFRLERSIWASLKSWGAVKRVA
jgi:RimJ/RimL family protein N-acetyltransferase